MFLMVMRDFPPNLPTGERGQLYNTVDLESNFKFQLIRVN